MQSGLFRAEAGQGGGRRGGELAGLTPAARLRELRLHQARQLLGTRNFGTVVQVAEAARFASAKHFSNLYAERFGRRPGDYRTPTATSASDGTLRRSGIDSLLA